MSSIAKIENDPEIQKAVKRIEKRFRENPYIVSDIIEERDGRTYQYVDVVMEGGGVLGVALIGYLYALERAGIRFLSIGGTSAGSIAALLLMAVADREEPRAEKLVEILFHMNLHDFIDGDSDAQDFSRFLAEGDLKNQKFKAVWKGAQVVDNVLNDFGLNPGDAFCRWIHGHLENFETETLQKLNERIRRNPPGLKHRRSGKSMRNTQSKLALVAADITTETKAVFPRMAPMYWKKPEEKSPALFVRASMSIPLFFHPLKVEGVARIRGVKKHWQDEGRYTGKIPAAVYFADGGIMSNFPISLFHEHKVPDAPTLGVKLSPFERQLNEIADLTGYGMAVFSAIRHYADYDFLYNNQDYNKLITYINTASHNWLNFSMQEAEKLSLFRKGVLAAEQFLNGFDWEDYKRIRKKLL